MNKITKTQIVILISILIIIGSKSQIVHSMLGTLLILRFKSNPLSNINENIHILDYLRNYLEDLRIFISQVQKV